VDPHLSAASKSADRVGQPRKTVVMQLDQRSYPNDFEDMLGWIAAAASQPGTRVLEIGCGDGAITNELNRRGIKAVGVDPHAPKGKHLKSQPFETLRAEPFDVIFASVSLHHLPDPAAATDALRRLSKPGTVMLVREFDRLLVNTPNTLPWLFHQRCAHVAGQPNSMEEWSQHWLSHVEHHVMPWDDVARVLRDAGFVTTSFARCAYLFRWELPEAIRPLEEHLIASGAIEAVGIRWSGCRTAVTT
jgi:ubiquinone/menaquinone biosynthesis C-methylase UbiE